MCSTDSDSKISRSESSTGIHSRHAISFFLLSAFLLVTALVVVGGYLYISRESKRAHLRAEHDMTAIADLKTGQISAWYATFMSDVAVVKEMPWWTGAVKDLLADPLNTEREKELLAAMKSLKDNFHFNRILIVDPAAKVRLAYPAGQDQIGPTAQSFVGKALKTEAILVSDLHVSRLAPGTVDMDAFFSVWSEDKGVKKPVGVIMFEINPHDFLFPTIQNWPTPSVSAETLLVRREGDEVVFLNELRHRQGSAVKMRLNIENTNVPAVMAVLGRTGVVAGVDYRSVPVVAALKPVAGTPWFMVAKIDQEEMHAGLRHQTMLICVILVSFVAVLILAMGILWNARDRRMLRQEMEANRRNEEILRADEQKFRGLFENMIEGVALHELVYGPAGQVEDYRILDINPAYEKHTGLSHEKAVGRLSTEIYNSSQAPYLEIFAGVAQGGKAVWFETYFPPLNRHFAVSVFSPGKGQFATIFEDITDKRKTDDALKNAQRLESLGVLAGGIAHDFNNLLGGLFGFIETAKDFCESKEYDMASQSLTNAMAVFARARDLTHQLLTFAKGGKPITQLTELSPVIRQTTQFALSGSNIKIEYRIFEKLWPCEIDRNQISQVMDNIIINARQAMPTGGIIAITADNVGNGNDLPVDLPSGNYVRIAFRDTGIGMPREHLSRIFDPFFTTKKQGSGLGLAMVYSIMKQHGGMVAVESEQGKGTTFTMYLPATDGAVVNDVKVDQAPFRGKGRILVMDDQAPIRQVSSFMLKRMGFEVDCAAHGDQAIEMFDKAHKSSHPFALVILDMTIPAGKGGVETICELKKIDPSVRAIACSGYSEAYILASPVKYGFAAILVKPYRKEELIDVLRSLGLDHQGKT